MEHTSSSPHSPMVTDQSCIIQVGELNRQAVILDSRFRRIATERQQYRCEDGRMNHHLTLNQILLVNQSYKPMSFVLQGGC